MDYRKVSDILKADMKPALGVTDPVSIALACAKAYEVVGGELESVTVITDPGIYKNGFFCAIPGTRQSGNEFAAILGALAGDPALKLEVLKNITDGDIEKASALKNAGIAAVHADRKLTEVYIDATVKTSRGQGRAVIEKIHDNVTLIQVDGKSVFEQGGDTERGRSPDRSYLNSFTLLEFKRFVDSVPAEQILFTLEAVKMNCALANQGMKRIGMGIGSAIADLVELGQLSDGIKVRAQKLTAFAVDARMGGSMNPAMSIAGSGDHGIVSTMPLVAIREIEGVSDEKLARAIALSYLVTIYIKNYSGILSAFCGAAITAGAGAGAGIVYLKGGSVEQIGFAINNMAANVTGLICDGGNFGCSLKAVTGVDAAVMSALFALNGVVIPSGSGIVGDTPEETMQNMGRIASPGMLRTNDEILNIMEDRSR